MLWRLLLRTLPPESTSRNQAATRAEIVVDADAVGGAGAEAAAVVCRIPSSFHQRRKPPAPLKRGLELKPGKLKQRKRKQGRLKRQRRRPGPQPPRGTTTSLCSPASRW